MNDPRKDREQLRQLWAARIADYRSSGLTMAAWCARHHIRVDQLKYWLYRRKLQNPSPRAAGPRFLPLTVTEPSPTLTVRVGSVHIDLKPGFDPQLLKAVVRALEEAPCSP
ncbi:MAG: hypothetical protein BLM47_13960 [Candidatus Reconcilbacillus cellulovorans]|uniref:Transposase n=1 Tax=Candidatus Reconcilbacillus cellulovorans TaxID=1906605 RepID=A0A2A6DXG8_9BACL|nr:MAG: hypothetical protein BLM47_13960 [Candidatus Reconcilbacillus cellulovorans]